MAGPTKYSVFLMIHAYEGRGSEDSQARGPPRSGDQIALGLNIDVDTGALAERACRPTFLTTARPRFILGREDPLESTRR